MILLGAGKESALQCRRPGFKPWVGKISWRRERLPTPVFWPGEFHALCSRRVAWTGSQSQTWLSDFHFHFLPSWGLHKAWRGCQLSSKAAWTHSSLWEGPAPLARSSRVPLLHIVSSRVTGIAVLSVAASHTCSFRRSSFLLEPSVHPSGSRSFISETVLEWFS